MKQKSSARLMITLAVIASCFLLFISKEGPQNNSGHKEATEADGKCRKLNNDPVPFDMIWENLTRQFIS